MSQEILDKINKRLEELEKVHTRYQGPVGKPGRDAKITLGRVESGDTASAQIREVSGNVYELSFVIPRGKDSTELATLREERNQWREEVNSLRRELYEFRVGACAEMEKLAAEYEHRLSEIFDKEVNAFCELRDKSCAEIEERMARLEGGQT